MGEQQMTLRAERYELLGDWWIITNDDAWISDAAVEGTAVEGTAEEMRAIAQAIRNRSSYFAKRCAVVWERDHFEFHSPRNSSGEWNERISPEQALALAEQIERDT